MKNRVVLKVTLLLAALGGSALIASAVEAKQAPQPVVAVQLDESSGGQQWAASNWTFYGCIQLGTQCYDVFQDAQGDLWVCKACGTTNNPTPGKCRRLTAYEIQNSRWCS